MMEVVLGLIVEGRGIVGRRLDDRMVGLQGRQERLVVGLGVIWGRPELGVNIEILLLDGWRVRKGIVGLLVGKARPFVVDVEDVGGLCWIGVGVGAGDMVVFLAVVVPVRVEVDVLGGGVVVVEVHLVGGLFGQTGLGLCTRTLSSISLNSSIEEGLFADPNLRSTPLCRVRAPAVSFLFCSASKCLVLLFYYPISLPSPCRRAPSSSGKCRHNYCRAPPAPSDSPSPRLPDDDTHATSFQHSLSSNFNLTLVCSFCQVPSVFCISRHLLAFGRSRPSSPKPSFISNYARIFHLFHSLKVCTLSSPVTHLSMPVLTRLRTRREEKADRRFSKIYPPSANTLQLFLLFASLPPTWPPPLYCVRVSIYHSKNSLSHHQYTSIPLFFQRPIYIALLSLSTTLTLVPSHNPSLEKPSFESDSNFSFAAYGTFPQKTVTINAVNKLNNNVFRPSPAING